MTLKLVFTASLFRVTLKLEANDFKIGALKGSVENKPASSLVEPLGKALSRIRPSWSG